MTIKRYDGVKDLALRVRLSACSSLLKADRLKTSNG